MKKNSGKILKRADGTLLLMPYDQPVKNRTFFYIIDDKFNRLKNDKGRDRTLLKNKEDTKEMFKTSKFIGYID